MDTELLIINYLVIHTALNLYIKVFKLDEMAVREESAYI